MHTLTRLKQAFEQYWTKFCKFSINLVAHEIENFLDFLNKDDFFGWARDRPEAKKALDERNMELIRLFKIVFHAELELGVIGGEGLNFMQWNENALEEKNMLRLQRGSQSRCNR